LIDKRSVCEEEEVSLHSCQLWKTIYFQRIEKYKEMEDETIALHYYRSYGHICSGK
jgi:hypothetical protein